MGNYSWEWNEPLWYGFFKGLSVRCGKTIQGRSLKCDLSRESGYLSRTKGFLKTALLSETAAGFAGDFAKWTKSQKFIFYSVCPTTHFSADMPF